MLNKFLISVIVLSFFACRPSERPTENEFGAEMVQVKLESANGCSDSTACASFEVNFPRFNGLDKAVASRITDAINNAIGYENPEADQMTIEQKGQRFIDDYARFREEFDDPIGWYFQSNAEIGLLSDTLISISVSSEFFTGGAHGGFTTYFVNMDPRDGSQVTLQSIFKSGFENVLTAAGEMAFRDIRVIPDSVTFVESGFEFRDNKFHLNDNYGFRQEGIVFFYNNYEIAPYSLGPTEIMIPFEVLRDWLK